MRDFESLIPAGYHPSYFIKLYINPKHIDINIHPTKTEIKFDDEFAIFAILRSAVKHSLGQYNIAPSLDFELNPDLEIRMPNFTTGTRISEPKISVNPDFNPFETEKPSFHHKKATEDFYNTFQQTTEQENNTEMVTYESKGI